MQEGELPSLCVCITESFQADLITLSLHFAGSDIQSKPFSFFSERQGGAEYPFCVPHGMTGRRKERTIPRAHRSHSKWACRHLLCIPFQLDSLTPRGHYQDGHQESDVSHFSPCFDSYLLEPSSQQRLSHKDSANCSLSLVVSKILNC